MTTAMPLAAAPLTEIRFDNPRLRELWLKAGTAELTTPRRVDFLLLLLVEKGVGSPAL